MVKVRHFLQLRSPLCKPFYVFLPFSISILYRQKLADHKFADLFDVVGVLLFVVGHSEATRQILVENDLRLINFVRKAA